MGQQGEGAFKVGDRVRVGKACGEYYPANAKGKVVAAGIGGCWIEFDRRDGVKQRPSGSRDWYAGNWNTTLVRPSIRSLLSRIRDWFTRATEVRA